MTAFKAESTVYLLPMRYPAQGIPEDPASTSGHLQVKNLHIKRFHTAILQQDKKLFLKSAGT